MSHLQTRSVRFFGGGSSYLSPKSTKYEYAQDNKRNSRIVFGLLHSCNEIHILQVLHGFFVEIPRTKVQDREQCEWEVVGYKCFVIPFVLEEDVPT